MATPNNRDPDFRSDLSFGKTGERLVAGILDGDVGVEVKRDRRASATGNAYVEVNCLSRGTREVKPSGIMSTTSDVFAVVIDDPAGGWFSVIIVPTDRLRAHCQEVIDSGAWLARQPYGSNPTSGVLVPLAKLIQLAGLAESE